MDIVGVLVLIDQYIFKLFLIASAHLFAGVHQADHIDQQVVEIHGVGSYQARLVELIDNSELIHPLLAVLTQQLLVRTVFAGRDTAVLRHRNTALYRAGFVYLVVQTAFLADRFDERFAVGGVVDGEIARVP